MTWKFLDWFHEIHKVVLTSKLSIDRQSNLKWHQMEMNCSKGVRSSVKIYYFSFVSLCRLLKDTLQDSQFSVRYQYLLAALLCCSGRGLREEFDRQGWLVNILAKLAQRVRDASPSSRQVSFTVPHLDLVVISVSQMSDQCLVFFKWEQLWPMKIIC